MAKELQHWIGGRRVGGSSGQPPSTPDGYDEATHAREVTNLDV